MHDKHYRMKFDISQTISRRATRASFSPREGAPAFFRKRVEILLIEFRLFATATAVTTAAANGIAAQIRPQFPSFQEYTAFTRIENRA
jgi:hypothetical protein